MEGRTDVCAPWKLGMSCDSAILPRMAAKLKPEMSMHSASCSCSELSHLRAQGSSSRHLHNIFWLNMPVHIQNCCGKRSCILIHNSNQLVKQSGLHVVLKESNEASWHSSICVQCTITARQAAWRSPEITFSLHQNQLHLK